MKRLFVACILLLFVMLGCGKDNPLTCEDKSNVYTGRLSLQETIVLLGDIYWIVNVPGLKTNEVLVSVEVGYKENGISIWLTAIYIETPEEGIVIISSRDPFTYAANGVPEDWDYEIITLTRGD